MLDTKRRHLHDLGDYGEANVKRSDRAEGGGDDVDKINGYRHEVGAGDSSNTVRGTHDNFNGLASKGLHFAGSDGENIFQLCGNGAQDLGGSVLRVGKRCENDTTALSLQP